MDTSKSNTEELISYCLQGDRFAQKSLFEKYAGKMMATCLRYATDRSDAQDILQEAFIKVFKNLKNFEKKGSFEGWIRTIVINTALNKKNKLSFSREKHVEENFLDVNNYEPSVISRLTADEILKFIDKLPEGYRIVFNLYVVEGYSHKEIGKLLDIKEASSRSQLAKARRMLQEIILVQNAIQHYE